MTTALKKESGAELKALFAALTGAIGEALGPLLGRPLAVRPTAMLLQEPDALAGALARPLVAARGELEGAHAGKSLLTLFDLADAIAMSGLLMMTPDDIIATKRSQGSLDGDHHEAFGELGNVLFSGFANVLRERAATGVRLQDHAIVAPGEDAKATLGREPLVTFGFRLKLGEYPESNGLIAVDRATAEAWNGRSLETTHIDAVQAPPTENLSPSLAAMRADDEAYERIPLAPIRGTLAAFVVQPEAFRTLRFACRRVGFELRRHGRGEIPNPAAHKNEVVVLDVPPGEDRRFDWCRRIKELSETTRVVLLVHHPSRQRVTQAFLSRADAILGYPCAEPQLSQKLAQLLQDAPEQ